MSAIVETPAARLASEDFGPARGVKPAFGSWLVKAVLGWGVFVGFLLFMAWALLAITRVCIWIGDQFPVQWGLSTAIGTILSCVLIPVMITATLLTMADRKWSALMQDRVGPNRARLSIIPGLKNMPLKGIPHIVADVLKMLFKEDFIPEGAEHNKWLFNLAPLLAFAPAFMLFAVVPVSPELTFWGTRMQLQVARVDWGILYVFALASVAVFGTALAGWTSNNKLALLGGLRASAQLVSLRGHARPHAGRRVHRLRHAAARRHGGAAGHGRALDPHRRRARQPRRRLDCPRRLGSAGLAACVGPRLPAARPDPLHGRRAGEIKRAPFDTPEGESEIIGYFLEYSGLKSGLFLIAEYAETVVVAGIVTSIFLGGYHLPWVEPSIVRALDNVWGISGFAWLAVLQVFAFIVKMLFIIWVMFIARWAFPRFRYDQIMRLGWKMMLPRLAGERRPDRRRLPLGRPRRRGVDGRPRVVGHPLLRLPVHARPAEEHHAAAHWTASSPSASASTCARRSRAWPSSPATSGRTSSGSAIRTRR